MNSTEIEELKSSLYKCDKEELIQRIIKLENDLKSNSKVTENVTNKISETPCVSEEQTKKSPKPFTKKEKAKREFDFKKFKRRHVFLKFLYFGWNYNGYVVQDNTDQTVEENIYKALLTTRLIEDREDCNMNRCGRTDKGVSAFSQVISVTVRSNLKLGDNLITPEDYNGPEFGSSDMNDELDYVQMLNGVLPKDIRFYCWAPVEYKDGQVSARFDCKRRTYYYYCDTSRYDFDRMNSAAAKLVGEHDFRNFCKMDIRNGVVNYVRKIYSAEFDKVSGIFKVEASAFLYHQIRCIMSLLMMIGEGLEDESIIDQLLDIDSNPGKPQYALADELPLVLFDVCYDENIVAKWYYGKNANTLRNVLKNLEESFQEFSTKSNILKSMINALKNRSVEYADFELTNGSKDKHKPLLKRPRCLTLEEALLRVNQNEEKKRRL